MKKAWILLLPPFAFILPGVLPLVSQFVSGVICDPNLFSGHFLEHLSDSPRAYIEQYIFPGRGWSSVPVLGPLAFSVTGIISTLWLVAVTHSDRDDRGPAE